MATENERKNNIYTPYFRQRRKIWISTNYDLVEIAGTAIGFRNLAIKGGITIDFLTHNVIGTRMCPRTSILNHVAIWTSVNPNPITIEGTIEGYKSMVVDFPITRLGMN